MIADRELAPLKDLIAKHLVRVCVFRGLSLLQVSGVVVNGFLVEIIANPASLLNVVGHARGC